MKQPMNKNTILALFLISVSCIALYSNTLKNPFVWDDHLLIEKNLLIQNWKFIPDIFTHHLFYTTGEASTFYRPLQTLTLLLDYHIWHFKAAGYHLTNLILHLLASILVYFLVLEIGEKHLTALWAGLLFAIHPIHTEAVSYIAGRADSLVTIFILLSLLAYRKNSNSSYICSVLFFTGALLSKELALIFPFILLLYELSFAKEKTEINPVVREKSSKGGNLIKPAPFFITALGYIYFRFHFLKFTETNLAFHFNRDYFLRLATSIKILFSYLGLLIFPQELKMARGYHLVKSFLDPAFIIFSFLLVIIIWAAIKSYHKSRFTFFFSFWFFIFLLPFLNILRLNALIAEHWLYIPSIGFLALLGRIIEKAVNRKKFLIFVFMPFFIYYASLTVTQNLQWQNEVKLYQKILKYNPEVVLVWYNLGTIYLREGSYEEAEKAFRNLLKLQPDHAKALVNLGAVYWVKGRLKEGEECARRAKISDPGLTEAYCLLGLFYAQEGKWKEAEAEYQESIKIDPQYLKGYLNLGMLYANKGDLERAIPLWKKVIEINPSSPEALDARNSLEQIKKYLNK